MRLASTSIYLLSYVFSPGPGGFLAFTEGEQKKLAHGNKKVMYWVIICMEVKKLWIT
jgi:hypothetical protein